MKNVVHVPPQNGMPAVGDFLLQDQLHQFLGERTHAGKTLTEGDNGEAHAFEILHHLHGSPAVEGNLPDIPIRPAEFGGSFN